MGRNVIVTGANRGIGKVIAETFVHHGDNVWACVRTLSEEVLQWADNLSSVTGSWVDVVDFDLMDPKAIDDGMKRIISEKRSIDVLVNCAGIGHMGFLQMTSQTMINHIYQVNVFAPMQMCKLVFRTMRRQHSGCILNISSIAAEEPSMGNSVYGSSKAALAAFSRSLAAEVAPYGIRVNAVAPGLTDTDMGVIFEGRNIEQTLRRSAIERKLSPVEIADAVYTLSLEGLRMVNGQVIIVNGGSK